MTDKLANDMLHAAGHAHMDIAGRYDAPAMRKAIGAALRVLAQAPEFCFATGADSFVTRLAARVEHPAEDGER